MFYVSYFLEYFPISNSFPFSPESVHKMGKLKMSWICPLLENYLNILKFCDFKKYKFPTLRSVINEHADMSELLNVPQVTDLSYCK